MYPRLLLVMGLLAVSPGCSATEPLFSPIDAGPADVAEADRVRPLIPGDRDPMTGQCYRETLGSNTCPLAFQQRVADHRGYRILGVTFVHPPSLAAPAFRELVRPAQRDGSTLWGFTSDPRGFVSMGAFDPRATRLGVIGLGQIDARYRFFADNAPGTVLARFNPSRAPSRGAVGAGPYEGLMTLPVFRDGDVASLVTALPLRQLRVVPVAAGNQCVGTPERVDGDFDECRSAWSVSIPGGGRMFFSGVIPLAEARVTPVVPLGTTLCSYLAGVDCDAVDLSTAPEGRRPNWTAEGGPGWYFEMLGAAAAATIEP